MESIEFETTSLCEVFKAMGETTESSLWMLRANGIPVEKGRVLLCKFIGSKPLPNKQLYKLKFLNLHTNKKEFMFCIPDCIAELKKELKNGRWSVTILLTELILGGIKPVAGPMAFLDDNVIRKWCSRNPNCVMTKGLKL